jgi:hypothetical protein
MTGDFPEPLPGGIPGPAIPDLGLSEELEEMSVDPAHPIARQTAPLLPEFSPGLIHLSPDHHSIHTLASFPHESFDFHCTTYLSGDITRPAAAP